MSDKTNLTLQGVDATIELFTDRVEITPKKAFKILAGKGSETIFIKDMTSVEVRECSFVNGGHIQFSAPGTNEKNNKVTFGGFGDRKSMNTNANSIKDFIIEQMKIQKQPVISNSNISTSDELLKLSQLKDSGILTESEFQSAKIKLLGL